MLSIGASGNIRVVVHESKIVGMHLPGGDIHRYADALATETARFAKIGAPKRTWKLTNSIRKEIDMRGAARGRLVARVRADAKYAVYVHEGTPPTSIAHIKSKSGKRLRNVYVYRVRGQEANPFLEDALDQAMLSSRVAGFRLRT